MLLSQLVENLALSVQPFGLCEVEAGRALDLGDYESTVVHFGLFGNGVIEHGGQHVGLGQHKLVIVPPGMRHRMSTNDRATEASAWATSTRLTHWHALGERNQSDLISACGRIQARYGDGPKLFSHLREPLAFDFAGRVEVCRLFDHMLNESMGGEVGAQQMLIALMNRCLLLVFRELCEEDNCALPWLSALEDSQLAAALDVILSNPGAPHSVESLALQASMSRTVFAERFRAAFGEPPMTFLRDVRLRRAAKLLQEGRQSISQVAAEVGYSSRAHFATAFSKRFGQSPSAFREHE